jgi:hypothetical protein
MNEYDDIARLFAGEEPPPPDDTFVVAVKARIDRERRRTKLLAAVSALAFAAVFAVALRFLPLEWFLPLHFLQSFLNSLTGIAACAVCAMALTAWLRTEDVW